MSTATDIEDGMKTSYLQPIMTILLVEALQIIAQTNFMLTIGWELSSLLPFNPFWHN